MPTIFQFKKGSLNYTLKIGKFYYIINYKLKEADEKEEMNKCNSLDQWSLKYFPSQFLMRATDLVT